MSIFKFGLNETVDMTESEERGTVIGRAEYTNKEPQYLIRYVAADGRQVESWWDQDAIKEA